MSVHLSVCLRPREQLGSHWKDFSKIWFLNIFRKSVHRIQVRSSTNTDKNNGHILHEDQYTFLIISRSFLLRMRNVSDESCRKKIKTRILCSAIFFENRAVYEI